jgi:hypothetical protein
MGKKTESEGTPKQSRKSVKRTTAGATAHRDDHKDDKGKDSPPPEDKAGAKADDEGKDKAEAKTSDKADDKASDKDKAEAKAEAKTDDKDKDKPEAKTDDKDKDKPEARADDAGNGASTKPDADAAVERPAQDTKAPGNANDKAAAAPQPSQAEPEPADSSKPRFEPLLPPSALPTGDNPNASADPPGLAPPGDSRSLRRHTDGGEEFVFIYRSQAFLIQRAGKVGTTGQWSCVEYPHIGAASHAYAQECSRLTDEGYRDLR